jgi:N-acyl-L-homoserine lactone synthetase
MSIVRTEPRQPASGGERSGRRDQRERRNDPEVRCREARSQFDRLACARLRADVYVWERRWVAAARLVDGLEVDGDDARSVHFLASCGREPVGTVRLILPHDGQRLPVESMLADRDSSGRLGAEVSRLAVVRHARGDSTVLMALVRGLCATAAGREIDDFYAIVEERLHRHLVWLGFPFRPVGPSRWVYRSWNFPVQAEVAGVAAAVAVFYSQREVRTERVSEGVS